MHPTTVRFSHTHGSASRRRCSYALVKAHKKIAAAMTPAEAEKHAHSVHTVSVKEHSEAA